MRERPEGETTVSVPETSMTDQHREPELQESPKEPLELVTEIATGGDDQLLPFHCVATGLPLLVLPIVQQDVSDEHVTSSASATPGRPGIAHVDPFHIAASAIFPVATYS